MDAFRSAWSRHALVQLRTSDPRARELLSRMMHATAERICSNRL